MVGPAIEIQNPLLLWHYKMTKQAKAKQRKTNLRYKSRVMRPQLQTSSQADREEKKPNQKWNQFSLSGDIRKPIKHLLEGPRDAQVYGP
ncbi:hypothetical protein AQUCO_05600110v1 [Aquilegia coerulea]|uniref:Uncharacterized protein n=1 Tax=Aquilegia coerulea TaxID=218851 RepID=A0A2G5CGJ7_AQUCA|nr:hypothetical protein AQUCO_05600110v1 [Aquilegia coerulea]